MPAVNKVGTQLLVSRHTRDRARALAIVRQESVAEVNRAALEGSGLKGLERQHAGQLLSLAALVEGAANRSGADESAVLNTVLSKRRGAGMDGMAQWMIKEFPVQK